MNDCVFCRIRDRQVEGHVVYEDDLVMAFMDLYPVNPGHVLVVPKEHLVGLDDVPDHVGACMCSAARRVGRVLCVRVWCIARGPTCSSRTGKPLSRKFSTCTCMSFRALSATPSPSTPTGRSGRVGDRCGPLAVRVGGLTLSGSGR